MPAKPLSHEQREDAKRLKKLITAFKDSRREHGLPAGEHDIAELLPFGQSAMSQYINGTIPLNAKAVLAFAGLLHVKPVDISPSIQREQFDWTLKWLTAEGAHQELLRQLADEAQTSGPTMPPEITKVAGRLARIKNAERRDAIVLRLQTDVDLALEMEAIEAERDQLRSGTRQPRAPNQ